MRRGESAGGQEVLNAFRHQRNMHLYMLMEGSSMGMCSTPFGIRGICTCREGRGPDISAVVLNAFRHQRNMHTLNGDVSLG